MFAMKEDEQLNSYLSNDALLDISFQIIFKIIWTPIILPRNFGGFILYNKVLFLSTEHLHWCSVCIDAPLLCIDAQLHDSCNCIRAFSNLQCFTYISFYNIYFENRLWVNQKSLLTKILLITKILLNTYTIITAYIINILQIQYWYWLTDVGKIEL